MLNKKEKNKIREYYVETCYRVFSCRKECCGRPFSKSVRTEKNRAEGRLVAIRKLVDLLNLPKDFLPNRDSIVV